MNMAKNTRRHHNVFAVPPIYIPRTTELFTCFGDKVIFLIEGSLFDRFDEPDLEREGDGASSAGKPVKPSRDTDSRGSCWGSGFGRDSIASARLMNLRGDQDKLMQQWSKLSMTYSSLDLPPALVPAPTAIFPIASSPTLADRGVIRGGAGERFGDVVGEPKAVAYDAADERETSEPKDEVLEGTPAATTSF
jgi:hypothetical protein